MEKIKPPVQPVNYDAAGVDMNLGDAFVEDIKDLAKGTQGPQVIQGIGGFGALFALGPDAYQDPVLVSGTDGVGTKVLLAQLMDRHDSVGIDLVAMCVNDILTLGAKPLFFLDYMAFGKLEKHRGKNLIRGIVAGCDLAGCALIGGETAEMPGLYGKAEYDLAGFSVGVVERKKIIDGKKIRPGNIILGLPSSGLHSNGYSLARRLVLGTTDRIEESDFPRFQKILAEKFPGESTKTWGEVLLNPTRIYVKPILNLCSKIEVLGLSHITGGGLPGNAPRVVPENCRVRLHASRWPIPKVFSVFQDLGSISEKDLFETFNMGLGMLIIIDAAQKDLAIQHLKSQGEVVYEVGEIVERPAGTCDFEMV